MVGPIILAKNVKSRYPKLRSVKAKGTKIELKNTTGKKVKVPKNQKVYHRGKGCFGIYTAAADAARKQNKRTKSRVGSGKYRQTTDKKRR